MHNRQNASTATFAPGDVLRYVPRWHHCREGTAFVLGDGRAVDTFWGHDGGMAGDRPILNGEELATAEVRFSVADYEMLDLYSKGSRGTWMTYHPNDRAIITSQHGLQEALFIRRGAEPDLATQIENARAKVEDAESKLRSAQFHLEWCQKDLAELEAKR